MKLVGASGQVVRHPFYDASGTITAGGTAQLVLARSQSRSFLKLQNLSNGPLWFEFGSARATAAISGGVVTGFTVTNVGFNFTKPPVVILFGGGNPGNSSFLGGNQMGYPAPSLPALAVATISGGAVNAVALQDGGGSGYVVAPQVFIYNSDLDPFGCAVPSVNVGMMLAAQSPPYILNGTACTTDQVAVFGATTGQPYLCKWMD